MELMDTSKELEFPLASMLAVYAFFFFSSAKNCVLKKNENELR